MTELQAQIESSNAAIAGLEDQITEAENALTAANDQSAEEKAALETQLASLSADLEAEQAALAEAEAEQEAARAEFEQRLSELRAYRIEREASDGESYLATQLGNMLVFDENGLCVDATLTNTLSSANSVVFELRVDDAAIYTSEPIAPGESITSIQLDTPLEPGNYEATAVQTAYAADGTYLSAVRIPVTLLSTPAVPAASAAAQE